MKDWAIDKKITSNLELETEQFIDYHTAKDSKMANWESAWRTWIRNSVKFSKTTFKKPNSAKPENFNNTDYGQADVRF